MFEKRLVAGWGDMDFNAHMRNTAFLDMSADVRMMFFSEHGFPMDEFIRRKIGPVIMKDEIEYSHEVRLLEELRVTLVIAGLAGDGSRFLIRNEFFRIEWEGGGESHKYRWLARPNHQNARCSACSLTGCLAFTLTP